MLIFIGNMSRYVINFFYLIFCCIPLSKLNAQISDNYEKQLWAMGLFNWRLNERWVYNQDFGLMHTFSDPAFNRIFLRSQINRQLAGSFSMHGGLIFIYSQNEASDDAIELRPWMGAKLRWPSFWRFDFVHYLRLEERFRHTMYEDAWEDNFRVRYKVSSSVPINHTSLIDRTFYGVLAYEFFSVSFDEDVRFTTADIHRMDLGMGFKHSIKSSYEFTLVAFNARDEFTEKYGLSSMVFFLKYKHYINWL